MVAIAPGSIPGIPGLRRRFYETKVREFVGITRFCIHPKAWFENKEKIGGTKRVNIDKIIALKPDLIIGNKEENTNVPSSKSKLSLICSIFFPYKKFDTLGYITFA